MALFPSDKPTKTIEGEVKKQDDPKVETFRNLLSSSSSDFVSDGFVVDNEFVRFDDEGMEMVEKAGCFISDSVVSDYDYNDDDLLVNVATIPVGVVLSVKGKQVIVEGKEKSNLLSTGCFLWLTETRVPLGYVDEIFGTAEKPCYSVRLELGSTVPQGISHGTQVSLIVTDSPADDVDKIVPSGDRKEEGDNYVVPQDLELPRTDDTSEPKKPYRPPMSKGIIPSPVPVLGPHMMMPNPPVMYQFFGNSQNSMNQQTFGLHQPYPVGAAPAPWPSTNSNLFAHHQPQKKYHQKSKIQLQPPSQKPSSSDNRGKMTNYRGAGDGSSRGFGRGRGRPDDKIQRW